MARLKGVDGTATIGGTAVKGVTQWSIDPQADEIETTGMDSQGWAEYLGGIKRWTATCEINWDGAGAIDPVSILGTVVACTFVSASAVPKISFSGNVLVTGTPTVVAHNDIVKLTFNGRGTGALSLTPTYA
jgi:predicted secreted protein